MGQAMTIWRQSQCCSLAATARAGILGTQLSAMSSRQLHADVRHNGDANAASATLVSKASVVMFTHDGSSLGIQPRTLLCTRAPLHWTIADEVARS